MSRVHSRSRMADSTAPSIAFAISGTPRCFTIIAALKIAPTGFKRPWPAISGAVPWTGSNRPRPLDGLMFADGAMPIPPTSSAVRSERMSPNRLPVTMTSNWPGSLTSCIAAASTRRWRVFTRGCAAATAFQRSCHRPPANVIAFDLSTITTSRLAIPKACSMIRVTPRYVLMSSWVAISSFVPLLKRPPWPTYSPSVFSRTIKRSARRRSSCRKGDRRSSYSRAGRRLTYKSRSNRSRSSTPWRYLGSGTRGSPTAPKRMASAAASCFHTSSGMATPVRRYESALTSNSSNSKSAPAARSTLIASGTTSFPAPSQGSTAIFLGTGLRGFLLAQLVALDLASHSLGQLDYELDHVRVLVALQPRLAVLLELGSQRIVALPTLDDDEGLDLGEAVDIHAHHRALDHRRVLEQRGLDLDRRCPQPADLDHVVRTAFVPVIPV